MTDKTKLEKLVLIVMPVSLRNAIRKELAPLLQALDAAEARAADASQLAANYKQQAEKAQTVMKGKPTAMGNLQLFTDGEVHEERLAILLQFENKEQFRDALAALQPFEETMQHE